MFQTRSGLNDLTTNYDELGVLWKALLRAIADNGGDTRHLNNLLADAKGRGSMFDQLARKAIGKIWELVETPVSMGDLALDDAAFALSPQEFLASRSGLKIASGLGFE